VVFQRYIWGFDLPVAGVVVGWVEKQECVDDWCLVCLLFRLSRGF
jgi:hypothetical protein